MGNEGDAARVSEEMGLRSSSDEGLEALSLRVSFLESVDYSQLQATLLSLTAKIA